MDADKILLTSLLALLARNISCRSDIDILDDDPEVLDCLYHAAEQGNADAQCLLGLLVENTADKKAPENEEAFHLMEAAAEQGHPAANYFLGNFYRSGTWVDADYHKAVECYTKAAEQGDTDGLERLGECYACGLGVPADDDIAFQCYQIAAESGNPKAQCFLGIAYLEGRGCFQNTGLGFQWISLAADSGHPAVFLILQNEGLDIARLSGGFRHAQTLLAGTTDDWFADSVERVFGQQNL